MRWGLKLRHFVAVVFSGSDRRSCTMAGGLLKQHPPSSPVDADHLFRVRVVLFQQQDSSDGRLYSSLNKINFSLSHEFFLQVCNNFPLSWKPVYRFFNYSLTQPAFCHSPVTFNKMLDVFGKSRNFRLLWDFVHRVADLGLITGPTLEIVAKHLASGRELKKCVELFHMMNAKGFCYPVETLNRVTSTLCRLKLVGEAKYIVAKLKPLIKPSAVTYGFLISGFCDAGDLLEACKLWNLMVTENIEPDMCSFAKIVERFFKCDRFQDGMRFFVFVRKVRLQGVDLSTYIILVNWMCRKGKLSHAFMMFGEMLKRGVGAQESKILSALVYGFLLGRRMREAKMIVSGIGHLDLGIYNGLIKGLLSMRKAEAATHIFRHMFEEGCEPNMHTYIMLLQAHLGKRGRKGPHPEVNFDNIFVGGLVKLGKTLEATKYVERIMHGGTEVPRFDYNKFLQWFSNEEGLEFFEEVGRKLKEAGLIDLGDIFLRYGEKMTTRERRRRLRS